MYKITSDGELKALSDTPCYIKVNKNSGAFIPATAEDAEGVSANGTPFNLPGHDGIKIIVTTDEETGTTEIQTAPVAIVQEVDGGIVTFNQSARIDNNEVKIDEVDETALTGLMATTDLYEELIKKGVLD